MSDGDSKRWWESKGVWGGLIAIAAAIGGLFGYDVTADDQTAIIEAVAGIAGIAGALIAIWGRVRARKRIG